jgi:hypothetical protein
MPSKIYSSGDPLLLSSLKGFFDINSRAYKISYIGKSFLATFSSNFVNPALNKASDQRKVTLEWTRNTTSALEAGLNIDISEGCPVHFFTYLPNLAESRGGE